MAKILDPDLLTYLVDGSPTTENIQIDTATKRIKLVAGGSLVAIDGVTGQCLYSKLKEIIKADQTLIKYKLPVNEMIHDESLELIHDWQLFDAASLKMVRDCGVAYVAENGNPSAMFACIVTLGTVLSGAPYFVQSSSTSATTGAFTHVNLANTFGVNELVQIYSDTNADLTPDYDYRAYFKVFLREQGKTYTESSNADIGYPTLTYKKYNFPITHALDAGVTKDDAAVSAYTGLSLTWGATTGVMLGSNGPYAYGVTIDANGHSYDEVYSWVQYRLRQTTDIDDGGGTRTGKVTPALVVMDGSTLKTKYQTGVGGIHISNPAASSLNNISEQDDTQAYRTYPYTASITLEFDSYLQSDGANAKFWLFDAATYGTAGATILQDSAGADITGTVTGLTSGAKSFGYTYSADQAFVGVAVGKAGAKMAIATGTIARSTGNKAVFVAGLERWYQNPV